MSVGLSLEFLHHSVGGVRVWGHCAGVGGAVTARETTQLLLGLYVDLLTLVHCGLQLLSIGLLPLVEFEYSYSYILHVCDFSPEERVPGRVVGQTVADLPRCQVDAGACDGLRVEAHKHVRAETVVHVVPFLM